MTDTTTIKVSKDTHRRFSALARRHHMSQPAYLAALVEKAERAEFWAAIDAIDPEDYQEAMRGEGLPEVDYSLEERVIVDEETGGKAR